MTSLVKTLFLGFLFVLMSGCAMFSEYQTKAAEDIARGIATYCATTLESDRVAFRTEVNALAAPRSIEIVCE